MVERHKGQRALKGLEIGCLAIIDTAACTALSAEAVQRRLPRNIAEAKQLNLTSHYVSVIKKRTAVLKTMGIKYLVADGYFMKQDFIHPLLKEGLHIITKMRPNANLRYPYNGTKAKGRGRPKLYDGKVDCTRIDKRRIRRFDEDQHAVYYSGIVYSIALKRMVRIIYVHDMQSSHYEILVCTDTQLSAEKIVHYYRLRFHIEFLIPPNNTAGRSSARQEVKTNYTFISIWRSVPYR